jgi:O-acetyl-ADP-ribose deacetylase (regulator of RNase III)
MIWSGTVKRDSPPGIAPKIIMFPTENHWRDGSRLIWIDQGLTYLKDHYRQWSVKSVAMPMLGCGLGGLNWNDVLPLIVEHFAEEELEVEVYTGYKKSP